MYVGVVEPPTNGAEQVQSEQMPDETVLVDQLMEQYVELQKRIRHVHGFIGSVCDNPDREMRIYQCATTFDVTIDTKEGRKILSQILDDLLWKRTCIQQQILQAWGLPTDTD